MGKTESSSPPKKSVANRSKKIIGCFILAGVLLAGLAVAGVAFGPRLLSLFGTGQTVTELSGLEDNTSPEQVAARREEALARLNNYGWVDQESGAVRIPIERAMVLIAESGLPVGTPTPTIPPPTNTPLPTLPAQTSAVETPLAEPSPTATPAPTVDLANVSFENHVLPIFEEHCQKCHGGIDPDTGEPRVEEGLKLLSYEDVMAGSWNGSVIEPGNVEDSYLIEQIVTGRMPKRGPHLDPTKIEIITAWVEAGAPNN